MLEVKFSGYIVCFQDMKNYFRKTELCRALVKQTWVGVERERDKVNFKFICGKDLFFSTSLEFYVIE